MNADGSSTGQTAHNDQIVDGENYWAHDDEVVVGRVMADRHGLEIGDPV